MFFFSCQHINHSPNPQRSIICCGKMKISQRQPTLATLAIQLSHSTKIPSHGSISARLIQFLLRFQRRYSQDVYYKITFTPKHSLKSSCFKAMVVSLLLKHITIVTLFKSREDSNAVFLGNCVLVSFCRSETQNSLLNFSQN